jgi:hypothetical protein
MTQMRSMKHGGKSLMTIIIAVRTPVGNLLRVSVCQV